MLERCLVASVTVVTEELVVGERSSLVEQLETAWHDAVWLVSVTRWTEVALGHARRRRREVVTVTVLQRIASHSHTFPIYSYLAIFFFFLFLLLGLVLLTNASLFRSFEYTCFPSKKNHAARFMLSQKQCFNGLLDNGSV